MTFYYCISCKIKDISEALILYLPKVTEVQTCVLEKISMVFATTSPPISRQQGCKIDFLNAKVVKLDFNIASLAAKAQQ